MRESERDMERERKKEKERVREEKDRENSEKERERERQGENRIKTEEIFFFIPRRMNIKMRWKEFFAGSGRKRSSDQIGKIYFTSN